MTHGEKEEELERRNSLIYRGEYVGNFRSECQASKNKKKGGEEEEKSIKNKIKRKKRVPDRTCAERSEWQPADKGMCCYISDAVPPAHKK